MLEKIEDIARSLKKIQLATPDAAEQFRLTYLSKKGLISQLFEEFKQVPVAEKKLVGASLNRLKQEIEHKWEEAARVSGPVPGHGNSDKNDLTLPAGKDFGGSRHPLLIIENDLMEIFKKLGFTIAEGPEVEDDWHNFTALNFPLNHPARDMQDTFFIEQDIALRTHTSSVQIRLMESNKPPMRSVMPGRVYRNEAISARANCFFHQVEGIYIDENVSFADLKQTLYCFVKELFGSVKVRFRPSYFPFTEPSAEMDIDCRICGGVGCNVCKHTGWVEILGCGMIDPNVLTNCGIDSNRYTGFAFGMGIERIAMLKYNVKDLRTYFQNDVRFLRQFADQ
jgi:phenylalanyl-tRNA synthetase alpha chain